MIRSRDQTQHQHASLPDSSTASADFSQARASRRLRVHPVLSSEEHRNDSETTRMCHLLSEFSFVSHHKCNEVCSFYICHGSILLDCLLRPFLSFSWLASFLRVFSPNPIREIFH